MLVFSFLTVFLMLYRVKGAILIGIFITSMISWLRGTAVTAFPYTEAGNTAFEFFKQVVTFHPIGLIWNSIDYHYTNGKVWYALVTMLYVDLLDTTGTLYSMAKFAGLRDPVTMDFEGSTVAYCIDGFSISMGALMGTSPVTAFIESATGISGVSLLPHSTQCRVTILGDHRGRKDWYYSGHDWTRIPCLSFLCSCFCQHSLLGYWGFSRNCWHTHGS